MEAKIRSQFCPICGAEVGWNERYPDHICGECTGRLVAVDGRPVIFGNRSINGGLIATYCDTFENYDSNLCIIDGLKCYAEEARFGGVVIRPLPAD